MSRIRVGVVGGSGYVGGNLLGLLLWHPEVEVCFVESVQAAGRPVAEVHTFLRGLCGLEFQDFSLDMLRENCDLVFLAKAHTEGMRFVGPLVEAGLRVIDLGADFRLKDAEVYRHWYGVEHAFPGLLSQAVYGLPELNREAVRRARLVANPGCYPTAVILALAPALAGGYSRADEVFVCAYSGISGAGRTPQPGKNLFLDAYRNIKPYKVCIHQHQPEMEQELGRVAGGTVRINFVPHLAPLDKGIYATIYLDLSRRVELEEVMEYYREYYRGSPFVRILPSGEYPQVADVVGTNFCDIGLALAACKGDGILRLVVFSALDNTMKGACGQAIQNMNLMFGLPETTGLYPLAGASWGT